MNIYTISNNVNKNIYFLNDTKLERKIFIDLVFSSTFQKMAYQLDSQIQ